MNITKKIFSFIALILVCFSAFAFVGCDSRENAGGKTLVVYGGDILKVPQMTQVTYTGDDWLKDLQFVKNFGMGSIKIKLGTFNYGIGTWYRNKDTGEWKNQEGAPEEKDKDNPKWVKYDFVTPYEHFIADGGNVTFNISKNPGTYTAVFSHQDARESVSKPYTIIEYNHDVLTSIISGNMTKEDAEGDNVN